MHLQLFCRVGLLSSSHSQERLLRRQVRPVQINGRPVQAVWAVVVVRVDGPVALPVAVLLERLVRWSLGKKVKLLEVLGCVQRSLGSLCWGVCLW